MKIRAAIVAIRAATTETRAAMIAIRAATMKIRAATFAIRAASMKIRAASVASRAANVAIRAATIAIRAATMKNVVITTSHDGRRAPRGGESALTRILLAGRACARLAKGMQYRAWGRRSSRAIFLADNCPNLGS
jgi:hypothetical protein